MLIVWSETRPFLSRCSLNRAGVHFNRDPAGTGECTPGWAGKPLEGDAGIPAGGDAVSGAPSAPP